jgi:3-dehydroquinate synthetase
MPEVGDGLVLVGMPGSGKSTAGRLVAERLGRPFHDTDVIFERLHGSPVPDYLAERGEPAFREAESAAVEAACREPGAVIAAGGGAVLDPLNRWRLWHHGRVAWLDASPETLADRLERDPHPRPTFRPYDPDRLASVAADRMAFYRAADLRLDGARRPDAVASVLLDGAGASPTGRRLFDAEMPRHHPIGPATARIVMGIDLDLAGLAPRGVAIVDRGAEPTGRAVAGRATLLLQGGERLKRIRSLERVLEWLAAQRLEREEAVIAVGGGTVGDLAGTAAAVYGRGVPLVQVPTTWTAAADSSLGGKVAVDLATAKNAVGAFWPPVAVLSDIAALRTLPPRVRRDGVAESVKAALIGDPILLRLLDERGRDALRADEGARYAILERSARVKLAICGRDPFESGERRRLNLGHTIGHALEVASAYRLRHGQAVALGLRAVASIAVGRGADADLPRRIDDLLESLGFTATHAFDRSAVREAIGSDKKRAGGRQRWILPMAVGTVVEVDDVSEREIDRALAVIAA